MLRFRISAYGVECRIARKYQDSAECGTVIRRCGGAINKNCYVVQFDNRKCLVTLHEQFIDIVRDDGLAEPVRQKRYSWTLDMRGLIRGARPEPRGPANWKRLPLALRCRWWDETDYGRITPSPDLAAAVEAVA